MIKYRYIGVGANKKTLKDYLKVVNDVKINKQYLISLLKQGYPLCVDIDLIKLHTVISDENDINNLLLKLEDEIYRYKLTNWFDRALCYIFGHKIQIGLCSRCLRHIKSRF